MLEITKLVLELIQLQNKVKKLHSLIIANVYRSITMPGSDPLR